MSRSINGPGNGLSLEREAATSEGLSSEAALPGGLLIDEIFGLDAGVEFQPAFRGNEETRSAQSFDDLVRYRVPSQRYALLEEIAVNIASNGEAKISVPGEDPVRFTGSIDINIPWNGAVLAPGSIVLIQHQSTDGADATQRASIAAREV